MDSSVQLFVPRSNRNDNFIDKSFTVMPPDRETVADQRSCQGGIRVPRWAHTNDGDYAEFWRITRKA